MRFRFLHAARTELKGASVAYKRIRIELGEKFKSALSKALDRIETWPLGCGKVYGEVRICRIQRFPYGIVYVARDEEIVVVAVMHLHRRPGYWKQRLKHIDP